MKRSLKLFNKIGKKPRSRRDVREYDEEFEEDYYEDEEFDEEYGDEDYRDDDEDYRDEDYPEDDYPDEDYPEDDYPEEEYPEERSYSREKHGDFDQELREDDDFDVDTNRQRYEDEYPEEDKYSEEDEYPEEGKYREEDKYLEEDEYPEEEIGSDNAGDSNVVPFPVKAEAEPEDDFSDEDYMEEESYEAEPEYEDTRYADDADYRDEVEEAEDDADYRDEVEEAEADADYRDEAEDSDVDYEDEDYDPEFEEDYGDQVDNRYKNEDDYPDEEDDRYEDEDDYPEDDIDDRYDDERDYRDAEDYDRYEEEYDEDYDRYDEDYRDDEDDYYVAATVARGGRGGRDNGRSSRASRADKKSGRDRSDRGSRRRGGSGAGAKIIEFVKNTSFAERAAAIVAVLLVVGGLITMSFYRDALGRTAEINSFAEVGAGMQFDDVIGSTGLLAVADAERARAMTAGIVMEEEEEEEEEVADDAQGVTIKMTLTTIKSDMKIKFINSETNKLVANVPFTVDVVTPDGTKVTYDDHDKDGIIYKNNLTAGKYKVTPNALPSEFSNYALELGTQSLTIKDTVETKVVDVSNEIKKESQVNAAKEDTAVQEVVESALTDTVEWVDSYVEEVDSGEGKEEYKEVKKEEVVKPDSAALPQGSIRRLSAARAADEKKSIVLSIGSKELKVGETTTLSADVEVTYESDSDVVSIDGNTVTAVKAGTAIITAKPSDLEYKEDSVTVTVKEEEKPEQPEQPQEPEKTKLKISLSVSSIEVEGKAKASATPSDGVKFKSSNNDVAKVDENTGDITGIKAGTADITAYGDNYEPDTVSIEVKEKTPVSNGKIPLNMTSIKVSVGAESDVIKANVEGVTITLEGGDSTIATFSNDSKKVKGVAAGKTTIFAKADNYDNTPIDIEVVNKETVPVNVTSLTLIEKTKGKISFTKDSVKPEFTSYDSKIIKVSEDGTIEALTAGSTTITVKDKSGVYSDVNVTITVVGAKELKDKAGNTLYVKDGDNYRVATTADYDKYSTFYKKETAKKKIYHGWQTIDGKTYYYDKNGNYVTGEQVIKGAKYTFGGDGVLSSSSGTLGIDVSKWNGNIDWNKVKNNGVNFVIIRCGYRGSSAGALIEDPKFRANIKGAQAAGLRVGVYFFSQAVNEVEAVEEASMCINLCKGYSLSFPIYIDVEGSNGRGDTISASQRTANIKAFCGTVQSAGYRAGVYSNKTWFTKNINTASLTNYKIWLAQYAANVSYTATRYDMWQYTSKGSVSGISGNVDMNILYN